MQLSGQKFLGNTATFQKSFAPLQKRQSRQQLKVRSEAKDESVVQPVNGDPFIGMMETPVTSSPFSVSYLSNLPIYRTGIRPLFRGIEIGLAHGYFIPGPFIKLGPLRNVPDVAEQAGSLAGAGLVVILTACLAIYGAVSFQEEKPEIGVKTLSGRKIERDQLFTQAGWNEFTAGWLVGGISGVIWCYILSQTLPYYS